jgi:ribosomal protein S17E
MINSNYGKTYNSFAEHPLSSTYFKYIDILIKDGFNKDIQHLIDIAYAPMTDEIRNEIAGILAAIFRIIKESDNDTNEFLELEKQIDNAH